MDGRVSLEWRIHERNLTDKGPISPWSTEDVSPHDLAMLTTGGTRNFKEIPAAIKTDGP